jgi:hypothetical protein
MSIMRKSAFAWKRFCTSAVPGENARAHRHLAHHDKGDERNRDNPKHQLPVCLVLLQIASRQPRWDTRA